MALARASRVTDPPPLPLPLLLAAAQAPSRRLLFTFFIPCVLRAHGGSGYTFSSVAILERCHPGKNPDVHI